MSQPQGGRASALSANSESLAFLLLLTTAFLLPFLDKPLHLDDPRYVWTAKRIVEHPADFYGMDVSWCYKKGPMARTNESPRDARDRFVAEGRHFRRLDWWA
jgi:hypothetical protein